MSFGDWFCWIVIAFLALCLAVGYELRPSVERVVVACEAKGGVIAKTQTGYHCVQAPKQKMEDEQ